MQDENVESAKVTLRQVLSRHRILILIVLGLALTFRIVLAINFPAVAGDESRYTVPAINMLAGHGFSSDTTEPYLPSKHIVPLYPLFVYAVYAVFGESNSAVRIAQGAIDVLTCLLVAFIAFSLAPPSSSSLAAIISLVIYGGLSWFTVNWTRYILTETLALFFTTLAIAVSVLAIRRSRWLWLVVGALCGLALLTRADSVLLVSAFVLFLIFRILRWRRYAIVSLLLFCLAVPVVLGPWILRNWLTLGEFQPLASEYGFARGGYMPTGYLWWIRTWMTDETYFDAFYPAFNPGSRAFDPHELPDSVFDSEGEKQQVLRLIARYNQTGQFTPDMSDEFRAIGNQRIRRAPLRFLIWLPIRRIASVWLTGFATHNPIRRLVRILLVLPILIGGVLGFAFCSRKQPVAQLLLLVIFTRTIFLAYHYAPEARYIVEAYPAMIAACGVSGAAFWLYCRESWLKGQR